jgi:dolichyl-diphosphooligosaccharide--protein glycosyltransferase
VAVLALVTAAFFLRTSFVRDTVLMGQDVRFAVADCWYHVRLVENLVHHFPHPSTFDPYGVFPGGQTVPVAPLFDWLLAAISLIVGGGQPTTRTIELVCAYAPAVLGALVVLPVYWLGRLLFNRTAGLLAAGLIAISPGHFLSRSLLGYTDHHIMEALLSAAVVLLLASALSRARGTGITSETGRRRGWAGAAELSAMGALAGGVLGLYLLTWIGGALFVGVLAVWLVLQFVADHVAGRRTPYLAAIALPMFVAASLIVVSWGTDLSGFRYHRVALVGAAVLAAVLVALSEVARRCRLPPLLFPLIVATAGVLAAIALSMRFPLWTREVLELVGRLATAGDKSIIPEALPLLKVQGEWSLTRAWGQFTTGFFLAIPALVLLVYRAVRQSDAVALLVALWSLVMLTITLGQNRFAYYYAVNVALLSGYVGAILLAWGHGDPALSRDIVVPGNRRHALPTQDVTGARWWTRARIAGVSLGVVLLLVYPNIRPAMRAAARIAVPHPDWVAAMRWLRENTPEPFGDPNAYYARYEEPPEDNGFVYPDTAYSVMNSWGYGYWIIRMGHRIPVANPGQRGATTAAQFFMARDADAASEILDSVRARYVVIESTMPYLASDNAVRGRITSLSHWAGAPLEELSETWYRPGEDGDLEAFRVYYPAYYRTMLARLYVFRGEPYEPEQMLVMSFRERVTEKGEPYKELVSAKGFHSYDEAEAYLHTQPLEQTRLVGVDPCASCVPLEPRLDEYRLIYKSPTVRCTLRGDLVSHVEIYEYTGVSDAPSPAPD